ncbi:MAG: hypothetical protein LBU12_09090 [Deltaproteobacteria bacterium]|nr:hypothetical protein [Deltaproteobacteria bacterium]
MARIIAVCVGDVKGGAKRRVGQAQLAKNFGLSGDADVGPHGRQLALLDQADFAARGEPAAAYGAGGENLVIEGLDLRQLKPGTKLRSGDALMELVELLGPERLLYRAKALLAGIVTEGDQIYVE